MPTLEDLTPGELLSRAKELEQGNRLFNTLLNDPETREQTLRLVKKKNPAMAIPELDARAPIEAQIEAERAERLKLEQQIQNDKIVARIDKERARVMKAHDLSDADITEVEKIMTDKDAPIPHYDAAAKVYKAQRQLATPTTAQIGPPTYEMPDKDTWAKGIGNKTELNKIAINEAYKAQQEFRSGNVVPA